MYRAGFEDEVFDPKQYFQEAVGRHSIQELIKINNNLGEEIKLHDHQIQSLVFENYTKFISSTDTVRQMKQDIGKIGDQLRTLRATMGRVSEVQGRLDSVFRARRNELVKLNTVNKDLQKLHSLCELPQLLKDDLAEFRQWELKPVARGNDSLFRQSIEAYHSCSGLLEEYKAEPMISAIYLESKPKLEDIKTLLWNLLKNHSLPRFQRHELNLKQVAKRLMLLAQDPALVLKVYLKQSRERVMRSSPILPLPADSAFVLKATDQAEVCSEFVENVKAAISLAGLSRSYMNVEFWSELKSEIQFIAELEEEHRPKALSREKQSDLAKEVEQTGRELRSRLADVVLGSVSRMPSYLSLGLVVELSKLFPDLDWKQVEARLVSERVTKSQTILNRLIDLWQKHSTRRLGEEKSTYVVTGLKELISQLVTQETLNCCVKTYFARPPLNQTTEYLDSLLSKLKAIIKEFVRFCVTSPSSLDQHQFGEEPLKPGEYSQLAQRLSKVNESTFMRTVAHQFLTLLTNTLLKNLVGNSYQMVDRFALKVGDEVLVQQFMKKKQLIDVEAELNKVELEIKVAAKDNYRLFVRTAVSEVLEAFGKGDPAPALKQFVAGLNLVFSESRQRVVEKEHFLKHICSGVSLQTEIMLAKKTNIFEKGTNDHTGLLSAFVKMALKVLAQRVKALSPALEDCVKLFQAMYELAGSSDQEFVKAMFVQTMQKLGRPWESVEGKREELAALPRISLA